MVRIVVAVVVVVVVVALVAWAVRRRGNDEVHSVDGYRHTLDTLQDIRSRSSSSSVRVLGSPTEPRPVPRAGGKPADAGGEGVAGPGGRAAGGSGDPVSEDVSATEAGGLVQPRTARRTQDRAISAMNRRPRRVGAPILVAVVVLALLALVVVIGAHSHHHPRSTSSATTHSTTATRSTDSTPSTGSTASTGATVRSGSTRTTGTAKSRTGGRSVKRGGSSGHKTTTTLPPSFTAVTSTATTATYTPPASTYTVTFTTTDGECWVTARSSAGSTLLSGTLAAGETKSVTASGKTSIILGAPSAVHVTIDHQPVVLPAGYQTPFYLTLVPATP
jgi:hypothetical protein